MTAFLAVALALVQALLSTDGPWQPAAVIVGWLTVLVVALTMLFGWVGGVAVVAGVSVLWFGIQGVAGDPSPGPVLSAVMLVVLIELCAVSLESRHVPLDPVAVLAHGMAMAAGAGIMVGLMVLVLEPPTSIGLGWHVAGVAAAVTLVIAVLALQRPRTRS